VADALRKAPGIEVELVDGNRGEFTVLVDGHSVAQKDPTSTPSVEQVLKAVKATATAEAGR
jgi:hypothetical protein